MDIDVYNIENNISIGDTNATIQLTSSSDIVVINNIITVLNSQLPDATIALDNFILECNRRIIDIDYTVFNTDSTNPLPANTPISFYADGILVGQSSTVNSININDFEIGSISLLIPENIDNTFQLTLLVDDDGSGNGIVNELYENNNETFTTIELLETPPIESLPASISCDLGFNSAMFNLIQIIEDNNIIMTSDVQFFESLSDLESNSNAILSPGNYSNSNNPQTIFVRVESSPCYLSYTFDIMVENCPPHIPQGFSPNNDNTNDWFNIQGLYDIFERHELKIFNRYGTLIFEGNNDNPWFGLINRGLNNHGEIVPVGTYYYVINFNDPNYESTVGWVYVNY
jgi:gliding motility-associated-like protein